MKKEQLPKDIEFNNLCDDFNNAKEENEKLNKNNLKLKKELDNLIMEEKKKDEEYNRLVDDLNNIKEEYENLKNKKENGMENSNKKEISRLKDEKNKLNDNYNNLLDEFNKLKEDYNNLKNDYDKVLKEKGPKFETYNAELPVSRNEKQREKDNKVKSNTSSLIDRFRQIRQKNDSSGRRSKEEQENSPDAKITSYEGSNRKKRGFNKY